MAFPDAPSSVSRCGGQTKREALVNAQNGLRDKGSDDPECWATFILPGAL